MQSSAGRIYGLVIKVAERCNLNCSYCYMFQHADQSYLRRPPLMKDDIFDQLLTRVVEYCDRRPGHCIGLNFHGGEPMLMGPMLFDRFATNARARLGDRLRDLSMQSNATLVDDRWIEVLRRHHVQVGISLDGPPELHDSVRVDHSGRGSHNRTLRGLLRLQEAGLSSGVLCVVNPACAGTEIYHYFRSLGIKNMNFLLPDVSHDTKERLYGLHGETPVADYLVPIFDDWYAEDDAEVKIRLFVQIISRILGGHACSDAVGNPLMDYLVIDTDGSIQANDVLKVCGEGIAESGLNLFDHSFDDLSLGLPLVHRMVHEGIPLSKKCQECHERRVCGGGMLPHRYARANGFDNPSVWCKDLLKLLTHIRCRIKNALSHQSL